jgi:hypothetical protein
LNGDVFVLPFNQQLESIEYLRLDKVYINTNMGNIISNCFPNLIDLDLSGTLVCDVEITSKNPHLQRAHFDIGDMDGYLDTRYDFVFKCPTMTVLQYYSCCFDEAIQVERGDIIGLPLLLVESNTVKKSEGGDGICIH